MPRSPSWSCWRQSLGRLQGGRQLALLAASTVVLFWLQPAEPLRTLGFWLPVGTLALTVVCWLHHGRDRRHATWSENWPAWPSLRGDRAGLGLIPGLALRLNPSLVVPAFRDMLPVLVTVLAICGHCFGARRCPQAAVITAAAVDDPGGVRGHQVPELAVTGAPVVAAELPLGTDVAADIPFAWLGFSYVAFRLLHTIRDRQAGRLPAVRLSEYVNYVIFFPAFTAGPIDRVERFVTDLQIAAGPDE